MLIDLKKLILVLFVLFNIRITFVYSQELEIANESFVSYEVEAKAFGLIPNKITGINQDVTGTIRMSPEVTVRLIFPVGSFRSGNTTRDESVSRILKSTEFPEIEFQLLTISDTVVSQVMNSDSGKFLAVGKLTAAGTSKQFDFTVKFLKESPNTVSFKTQIYAKFTDFGLDPPVLGYIVQIAPDQVLLKGELIVNNREPIPKRRN